MPDDLVERLRENAKPLMYDGNEAEELANAAVEAANKLEALQRQLGECSGGYQTLEREVEALRKRVQELEAKNEVEYQARCGLQADLNNAEAELADKAAERLAYDAVIDLLFERLPDANCMGELPGVVDELRQQLAAVRALLPEIRWCVDYMASGMTHAAWVTERAEKLRAAIDAARAKEQ